MRIIEATGWKEASLVVVEGDIDVEDATELETFALAVASSSGRPGLVIDMSGVDFMGSASLASLLHVKDRLLLADGWLRLREPSPAVRRVLEIAGTTEEFLLPPPAALTSPDERFRSG